LGGHPHITALHENYDVDGNFLIVLDYIAGGEMFDHLVNNGAYSEADAARLVGDVASALAFLHGLGIVHCDLKPENLMLSTNNRRDSIVKLVDFGCAASTNVQEESDDGNGSFLTPGYSPPEAFLKGHKPDSPIDMWSFGVLLFIMLTGAHPFDIFGTATDEEMEAKVKDPGYKLPIRNNGLTKHLSESVIELLEQLMDRNPKTRMTADKMLQHPWVRGETASTKIIVGSDTRLQSFRKVKSKVQRSFFENAVTWSDNEDDVRRKTNLVEQSFQLFDKAEVPGDTGEEPLTMSDFQGLLSENMKNMFFPKGHVVYDEGK
jgi:serine/threonine protein kinase